MSSNTVYDFTARTIEGGERTLSDYRGKVLLVVNVASECGFTPQYEGLEALHERFRDRGFAVLGFPCNQFGAQEPGSEAQIKAMSPILHEITSWAHEQITAIPPEYSSTLRSSVKAERIAADSYRTRWRDAEQSYLDAADRLVAADEAVRAWYHSRNLTPPPPPTE